MGVFIDGVEISVRELRENNRLLKENTLELKKFNQSSTKLALAMIALGVISIVIAVIK